jgi:hypothetical protein
MASLLRSDRLKNVMNSLGEGHGTGRRDLGGKSELYKSLTSQKVLLAFYSSPCTFGLQLIDESCIATTRYLGCIFIVQLYNSALSYLRFIMLPSNFIPGHIILSYII